MLYYISEKRCMPVCLSYRQSNFWCCACYPIFDRIARHHLLINTQGFTAAVLSVNKFSVNKWSCIFTFIEKPNIYGTNLFISPTHLVSPCRRKCISFFSVFIAFVVVNLLGLGFHFSNKPLVAIEYAIRVANIEVYTLYSNYVQLFCPLYPSTFVYPSFTRSMW